MTHNDPEPTTNEGRTRPELRCTRCDAELRYLGKRGFHEASGFAANCYIGEFFDKQQLHVYYCEVCGHLDLFLDR